MAIRIYACKWIKVGKRITNPILEYLKTQDKIPGFEWVSMHYGESNVDGTPKNPICMVFVKTTDFTAIDKLSGILKFPARDMKEQLSETQKNEVIDALDSQFNVAKSTFADAATQKDVMNTLAKHIHPQFKTIGKHIDDKEFE